MSDKKASYLQIIFIDYSSYTFPFSDVVFMELRGIKDNIIVNNGKFASTLRGVDELLLMLSPKTNEHAAFSSEENDGNNIKPMDMFERICTKADIFSVRFVFEDNSLEEIVLPWNDYHRNMDSNSFQKAFYQQNCKFKGYGSFCIHVCESTRYKDIQEIFYDADNEDSCDSIENDYSELSETESDSDTDNIIVEETSDTNENTADKTVDIFLDNISKAFSIVYNVSTVSNHIVINSQFKQHNGDLISASVTFDEINPKLLYISDDGEVANEYLLAGLEEKLDDKSIEQLLTSKGFKWKFTDGKSFKDKDFSASICTEVNGYDEVLVPQKLLELLEIQIILFAKLEELRRQ